MILKIKNLKIFTIIGVNQEERIKKQQISLNIKIKYNCVKSIKTDNIKDTLDYNDLIENIQERVKNTNFFLLEKLIDFIFSIIFEYEFVEKVKISINKENLYKNIDKVSISDTRIKQKK